jgi:hypothetical protein
MNMMVPISPRRFLSDFQSVRTLLAPNGRNPYSGSPMKSENSIAPKAAGGYR